MRHPLVGDRRDDERSGQACPSTVASVETLVDAEQDALPQALPREGGHVLAQRALVAGAAGEVPVPVRVEPLGGEAARRR